LKRKRWGGRRRFDGIKVPEWSLGTKQESSITKNGVATKFLYDGTDLIAEYDGNNNLLRRYRRLLGRLSNLTCHRTSLEPGASMIAG
jgi:hypothetical protein